MRYRTNKRTGDRISEIGIGSSYMYGAGAKEAVGALRRAAEGGVNYFASRGRRRNLRDVR
jgi:aryl-alcohol dehydrogenase-like predicted oxidoreductase